MSKLLVLVVAVVVGSLSWSHASESQSELPIGSGSYARSAPVAALSHRAPATVRVVLAAPVIEVVEDTAATTWAQPLDGDPDLTVVYEDDDTGDWITIVDDDGTELCMFALDADDVLDDAHVADVCGWSATRTT